jgi:hypothetical protein
MKIVLNKFTWMYDVLDLDGNFLKEFKSYKEALNFKIRSK